MSWSQEVLHIRVHVLTICVSLITSAGCDSVINVMEGEWTLLVFPYPCDSSMITIQYANGRPFYSSDNPRLISNAAQYKRFTVEDKTNGGNCSLQLGIDSVSRTDSGTYILFVYSLDIIIYITRVALYVDFVPGKAHCRLGGSPNDTGDWIELDCSAPVGSISGQIQCYQNDTRMSDLTKPSETSEIIEQSILIQQNDQRVFCCSSPLIEPKATCDCLDFVWDPLSQSEVEKSRNPCPAITPAQVATFSKFPTYQTKPATAGIETMTKTTQMAPQNKTKFNPAVLVIIPSVVFVIIFVAYLARMLTKAKFAASARSSARV